MLKNRKYLGAFIILLFTLTVSVPLFPCDTMNIYGLFGEIQATAVVNESREEVSEIASRITTQIKVKGANIFNIWFLIAITIVCLAFEMHIFKLPRADTIVAKKVRMDN